MGIIARQSFKAATVTYLGVAIGMVNALYIYTKMLSVEQYGEISFMFSTVASIAPFLLFGYGAVLVKFYPHFKEDAAHKQRLYSFVFGGVLLNVILFISLYFLFRESIMDMVLQDSEVSVVTISAVVGMCCVQPFILLSITYASIQGRIAVPSALLQLIKLVLPVFVILYFLEYISFYTIIYGMLCYYFALAMLYVSYAWSQDSFKPKLDFKKIRSTLPLKSIMTFAGFSVLGSAGAVLTNQVDVLMVTSMLGTYQTGLYGWSLFIANAIAIPYGLIGSISTPLISKYWKEDDKFELNKIYKQSSSSLMVISIGLFICIVVGLDDLFLLMPKGDKYGLAKYVVIMLCIAKIIDMATGLNNQIFSMSDKYKYLMVFLLLAVVLNVGMNLLLIPMYGIEGSAIATIISIVIYNLMKYLFLKSKYDLDPFSKKTLKILGLAAVVLSIGLALPKTSMPLLNIALLCGFTFILFFLGAYKFHLSPELNGFLDKQLRRIGIKPLD